MARLRVSTKLDATPDVVWADLADISSHVEWMRDAVAIRFTSDRQQGTGTSFDCDTKVGPFRLTDRMEITAWEPGAAMGVRHTGLVTGDGVIRLRKLRRGRTRLRPWRIRVTTPAGIDAMAAEAGTRFLVVTHHPLTMARMHRLYGVTMQERGVSRLLSVDLGQAVQMAEGPVAA